MDESKMPEETPLMGPDGKVVKEANGKTLMVKTRVEFSESEAPMFVLGQGEKEKETVREHGRGRPRDGDHRGRAVRSARAGTEGTRSRTMMSRLLEAVCALTMRARCAPRMGR
ncbi:hypothetical protein [Streptomyces sp. SS52]|uniref:hypothetical protein n=1 Tax=Streptomyces sp. SS52 TaxID=2563602 RepID=UPI001FF82DB2|nr:hypothetical protein [Streptomyces sp. SS52]